jgi:hypothetical protein
MNKKILAAAIMSIAFSSGVFAHGACGHTELHDHMIGIKDELKLMSSDVKSGDNESAVKRVHSLISYFEQAHNTVPHSFMSDNLQGEELAKQKIAYTKILDETIEVFNSLEMALESNDSEEVKKLFGKIGEQRNMGHRAFKGNC